MNSVFCLHVFACAHMGADSHLYKGHMHTHLYTSEEAKGQTMDIFP